jgi:GDP/UDP-N,N'-diacetylbacillosamine 2-epimerase (hydrolysing)
LLHAVRAEGLQAICLLPNADTGNSRIRAEIDRFCADALGFRAVTHLERGDYVSLVAAADLLIGNSSSGIIEAATFGTPVVNVGDRQLDRERNVNVIDAPAEEGMIRAAIRRARSLPRDRRENVYGDGQTDMRVTGLMTRIALDDALLKKSNAY